MPKTRRQRRDPLQVASEVWRHALHCRLCVALPRVEVSDAKKRKALESEKTKLNKLLAEQMMDVSTLKEMLGRNF